jgi:hypothetical protein
MVIRSTRTVNSSRTCGFFSEIGVFPVETRDGFSFDLKSDTATMMG